MLACRSKLTPCKPTVRLLETQSKGAVQQRYGLVLPSSGLPHNVCGSALGEGAELGRSCNGDQPHPAPSHPPPAHPWPQIMSSNGDQALQLQADLENTEVKCQQLLHSGASLTAAAEEGSLVEASLHPAPVSHLDFSKNQTFGRRNVCLSLLKPVSQKTNKQRSKQAPLQTASSHPQQPAAGTLPQRGPSSTAPG